MAFSPVPLNLQSHPSTSASQFLYFVTFHPKSRSVDICGGRKLKICCYQRTVQIEDETNQRKNMVKKKRKPRPSFLEQIQDKWSLKSPSLRENFPWEVTQSDGKTNLEFKPDRAEFVGRDQTTINELHEQRNKEEAFVSDSVGIHELVKEAILEENNDKISREKSPEIQFGLGENDGIGSEEACEDATSVESSSVGNGSVISNKNYADRNEAMRMPWESAKDEEFGRQKPSNLNTRLAELLIPEPELKSLRSESLRMVERIKVGAAGVTQALVDTIHKKWKDNRVVKLKFEGPPSMNMKRTHKILEDRTGGLVIWRSGGLVVLYRGISYKLDCVKSYTQHSAVGLGSSNASRLHNPTKLRDSLPDEEQIDISEVNGILDELGPRFRDWSGPKPVPVDADLLPAVVPGYKTPFRLLPYGTRHALRDSEMTLLRRTARKMPPHFALGRSRELQGLASAIVKLWEKSAIAKIAIKRGVQNTSNERIAEELKRLTGGTLLSRNKEFIVIHRGNDFLPPGVSSALTEAEKRAAVQQDEEDQARDRAAMLMINLKTKTSAQPLVAGTLTETVAATSRWGSQPDSAEIEKMMRDAAIARHVSMIDSLHSKLAVANGKIGRAEKALRKVLENHEPEALPTDLETLTDEERFLLRRIGLSMKPYLLLGRREIFDGTIENMHLHWKYREVVKIIVKRKSLAQVKHIAVSLEAESGGVLVSVEKTTKGYVIIVYRGKNYQRPLAFRPRTLLTKRQALARSIELQRREALKHHAMELVQRMEKLKEELEEMRSTSNKSQESSASNTSVAADDSSHGNQDV
ncbi:CRM-domain containing factor CFM3, chloroplastic/mitochondrial [Andrographis paniculata]|uniref:CRM-domain containing factor CFM3, chloroplastic/mitochondrial n=1 Tax=Andrographis paniculata TaxID=175694 RepID=UPI0021E74403|nr:CRM-domain containing factor CFM3, chloroplastic/mitochondrial [Andrographis paniculata]